jgi:hypothetical protein
MNGVQLVKTLGQNLKVPSTKISSAELVKNQSHCTGRKIHSGLPKSREDVHNAIELMDTRTSKNEEFVITNDDPSGLIIFSCSSNLEFFTNTDLISSL